MKSTRSYVKEFGLDKSDSNFSHSKFVEWLSEDFFGLRNELMKVSDFGLKQFNYCVREIRNKWDSINNKTLGNLPDKLWNYFYAQIISKTKDDMFPEVKKQKETIFHYNNVELVEYLRDNGCAVAGIGRYDFVSEWQLRTAQNYLAEFDEIEMEYEVVKYALNVYIGRLKSILEKIKQKREEAEKKARERAEYQWKHWQDFENAFNGNYYQSFFDNLFKAFTFIPTNSFKLLGFESDFKKLTIEEIKKNYRKLAMQHHPDKGGKQEDFVAITVAKDECISYLTNLK